MKAAERLRAGEIVRVTADGMLARYDARRGVSPHERAIRRIGRILRIRRLAHYHEEHPIGIALQAASPGDTVDLLTNGSFWIDEP